MDKKTVEKIVIKGASGYCPAEYFYNDKITITPDSISYECKPYLEDGEIKPQKWTHKITSKTFKQQFDIVASEAVKALEEGPQELVYDAESLDITVTFSDKTKHNQYFSYISNFFNDLFAAIKELVPETEETPIVLK